MCHTPGDKSPRALSKKEVPVNCIPQENSARNQRGCLMAESLPSQNNNAEIVMVSKETFAGLLGHSQATMFLKGTDLPRAESIILPLLMQPFFPGMKERTQNLPVWRGFRQRFFPVLPGVTARDWKWDLLHATRSSTTELWLHPTEQCPIYLPLLWLWVYLVQLCWGLQGRGNAWNIFLADQKQSLWEVV